MYHSWGVFSTFLGIFFNFYFKLLFISFLYLFEKCWQRMKSVGVMLYLFKAHFESLRVNDKDFYVGVVHGRSGGLCGRAQGGSCGLPRWWFI